MKISRKDRKANRRDREGLIINSLRTLRKKLCELCVNLEELNVVKFFFTPQNNL
jgi:hypothetical protein